MNFKYYVLGIPSGWVATNFGEKHTHTHTQRLRMDVTTNGWGNVSGRSIPSRPRGGRDEG